MNLHKTKIDWCSHTWNPVTGCLHGCEYCYARRTTQRFAPHPCERPGVAPLEILPKGSGCFYDEEPTKLYDETGKYVRTTPYPAGFAPTFHPYTLDYPAKREIPSTVFVSSMGDLFGEWVPDIWIEDVFAACKRAPQHTYLFLTKNPKLGDLLRDDDVVQFETGFDPDELAVYRHLENTPDPDDWPEGDDDPFGADDPDAEEDGEPEDPEEDAAGEDEPAFNQTIIRIGHLNFKIEVYRYKRLLEQIRDSGIFDEKEIAAEMKRRLLEND